MLKTTTNSKHTLSRITQMGQRNERWCERASGAEHDGIIMLKYYFLVAMSTFKETHQTWAMQM